MGPIQRPTFTMKAHTRCLFILTGLFAFTGLAFTGVAEAQTHELDAQTRQLDAYWAELSRTVAEGDFEGYAALYHEDAALVSNLSQSSIPIAKALSGWKQGFIDTRDGKMTAEVTFRFSQRYSDGQTAHETGIFRYVAAPVGGEPAVSLIHFEALMVKKEGWKMIMEYQKSRATPEEWQALE